ncbi:hypothetical protein H072_11652 [Dactylellina haptotyla CBS 200.50]|uniref:Reverse transcriptase domain-containing protein n=1 Tax=Dactylellina haptotyla (strain CBS 200.50) TaxID=1284197 RepID=S7ZWC1_DACHA|nr:hypothetical protein H072_11652 [Dactylellina haptotyla CBS 200.50]
MAQCFKLKELRTVTRAEPSGSGFVKKGPDRTLNRIKKQHFQIPCTINGNITQALADSGAETTYISEKYIKKHNLPIRLKDTTYNVVAFGGSPLGTVRYEIDVTLIINKHLEKRTIDILNLANDDLILGYDWLEDHDPIRRVVYKQPKEVHLRLTEYFSDKEIYHRSRNKPNTLKRIWLKAKDIIRTFEKIKDEDALPPFNEFTHEIPLQKGTTPKFLPVYACTKDELEALREYIEENLRKGYIRPSRSPAGHPILFVPKKNRKLRICIDYRSLNAITIKDRNSLPQINESLDRLIKATHFTKLNIIVAYHNLQVAPKDVWKTAFRCRYKLFEYLIMPMGLTNAPASFQTFMNHVLKDHIDKICIVYLDDILVYSKNPEEHRQHVITVLEALDKYNLKVELEKTEFEVTECEFLGAIVTTEGIKMDPKKVDAIQKWPRPQNVKDIQAFLGLCNYYRRFIKQYSHMSTALSELTKIGVHFDMTPSRIRAFNILKEFFLSAPILKLYDPDLPIKIEIDVSDAALGACLCQLQPNQEWYPIAYLSHKFDATKLRYPIHDKELMAIVQACKT